MTVAKPSSVVAGRNLTAPILPRMEQLHVYRLSDDSVPVVVISWGPLPPPGAWGSQPLRELIGVYDRLEDARDAANRVRSVGRADAAGTGTGASAS